jgi:HD superfamily phosphodiesterase
MNLTGTIESAENQFKQILEEFFISVYNEKSLSSHGIDHHRRVWNYAIDLLKQLPSEITISNPQLPSELLVACYMHDIGMTVDPGVKHGKHSASLCIEFLKKNSFPEKEWQNVLEAIYNHDNKEYVTNSGPDDLLTILSVADDLDAFGCIGIYRYSEIYLTREIGPDKIGYMIRENAGKRYNNFIKIFGSVDELVVKHWERYYLLDMFFSKYNDQLPSYQFGTSHPSGFCGVVEVFANMIKNKIELKDIYSNSDKYLTDPIIKWFFGELKKEILCS